MTIDGGHDHASWLAATSQGDSREGSMPASMLSAWLNFNLLQVIFDPGRNWIMSTTAFTRIEVIEIILDATATCAPVTVKISKDSLLIMSCPPVVLGKIMASLSNAWQAQIHDGGLFISAK